MDDKRITLGVGEETARIVLEMGANCYSEGLLTEEAWNLCQIIRKGYTEVGPDWFRSELERKQGKR